MEETPRSNSTPSTDSSRRSASSSGISSYTACTRVIRSRYAASRAPASSSACWSRSTPITRADGQRSRTASAWPPRPRVASTSTESGCSSVGATRATTRSRSTGTWRGVLTSATDVDDADQHQCQDARGDQRERHHQQAVSYLVTYAPCRRDPTHRTRPPDALRCGATFVEPGSPSAPLRVVSREGPSGTGEGAPECPCHVREPERT